MGRSLKMCLHGAVSIVSGTTAVISIPSHRGIWTRDRRVLGGRWFPRGPLSFSPQCTAALRFVVKIMQRVFPRGVLPPRAVGCFRGVGLGSVFEGPKRERAQRTLQQ